MSSEVEVSLPEVGDIVLWFPDRFSPVDMAQPAIVTRVSPPVVALGIISYNMTYVRPVDGVRHKGDQWLKDRPGAELRTGVWDWKPNTRKVSAKQSITAAVRKEQS